MPTLDQIHAQINALPHKYIFYTKKEIKYLPEIMAEGEEIRALTSGFMNNKTWLAVCTNRRVLFIDKGMIFGLKTVQMNLDRIQSIDSSYVILFGSIRIFDGGSAFVLRLVLKDSIQPFVKAVREAIDEYRKLTFREVTSGGMGNDMAAAAHATGHAPQPQAAAAAPQVNMADQLERLAALKDAGHLTQEEFDRQKKKMLSGV